MVTMLQGTVCCAPCIQYHYRGMQSTKQKLPVGMILFSTICTVVMSMYHVPVNTNIPWTHPHKIVQMCAY